MVQINNFRNFINERDNAYNVQVHLDSKSKVSKEGINAMLIHLNDCIKNPTIGLLIRKDAIKEMPNFREYIRNKSYVLRQPEIIEANNNFEKYLKQTYPRTLKARLFLIEHRNIILGSVKPLTKSFKKTLFKLTRYLRIKK